MSTLTVLDKVYTLPTDLADALLSVFSTPGSLAPVDVKLATWLTGLGGYEEVCEASKKFEATVRKWDGDDEEEPIKLFGSDGYWQWVDYWWATDMHLTPTVYPEP